MGIFIDLGNFVLRRGIMTRVQKLSLLLVFALLLCVSDYAAGQARDIGGKRTRPNAGNIPLYEASYALVIGVSDYTNGWSPLRGVKDDIPAVVEVLKEHGFEVETVWDPNSEELQAAFKDFVKRRGMRPDARLLFYFAGHGHTERQSYGAEMGYIVPTDAPNPHRDREGFLGSAMRMDAIELCAKQIQSKHALFLFDACFAGTIFTTTRGIPEYISDKTKKPVRQFITSGSADEPVPDESIFRRELVNALNGEADTDGDGYVTGMELGEYLYKKVTNYSKGTQHPQHGKIQIANLDKGDFVFKLKEKPVVPMIDQDTSADELPPPPNVKMVGHLQIKSTAPNAKVTVNGEPIGIIKDLQTPVECRNLPLPEAIVRVEVEGHEAREETVNLAFKAWRVVVFDFSSGPQTVTVSSQGLKPVDAPAVTPAVDDAAEKERLKQQEKQKKVDAQKQQELIDKIKREAEAAEKARIEAEKRKRSSSNTTPGTPQAGKKKRDTGVQRKRYNPKTKFSPD